jgi:hypothetical protein
MAHMLTRGFLLAAFLAGGPVVCAVVPPETPAPKTYRNLKGDVPAAPREPSRRQDPNMSVIDDFDAGIMGNKFKGYVGIWESNPADADQYCRASIESNEPRAGKGKYLRIDYDVDSPHPVENGYWSQLRNADLSRYDHLQFWVRGDKQRGYTTRFRIELKKSLPAAGAQDPGGADPEWIKGSFVVTGITDQWQKISIPLRVMSGIRDWKGVDEFVIVFKDRVCDRKVGTIYIDDIAVVRTGDPGPSIHDPVVRRIEKGTQGLDAVQTAQFLIHNRLHGTFPGKVVVKKQFPEDDRAFLTEIARDTWRFFDVFTDKLTHLPLDTIQFPKDTVIGRETFIGDYTNVTNIGLYLMCVVSAYDLGFISRDEAVTRLRKTLDTVGRLETYKHFPYNYYDTSTLERTSNFISYVDSGWLAIGMYVAKNAFPEELSEQAAGLLNRMDFSFFYDDVEQQMFHGYYTNAECYSEYHYGAFYTEPRVISYMAIGKGDAPLEHWFKMYRTFPKQYAWQKQRPIGRSEKKHFGISAYGGYYEHAGVKYVPSWGGSLFEALMPTLVLEEKERAPEGLGLNDEVHARIHIAYALDTLNYPVWGLSPSSSPGGGYGEYGVPFLGARGYQPGVVTPHVTFLALEFFPAEAIKNLRKFTALYDIYGECGFYDAVDPLTGRVAYRYLALDQAMSLIALNNYLNDGAVRKRFARDPINKDVKKVLEVEKFFQ